MSVGSKDHLDAEAEEADFALWKFCADTIPLNTCSVLLMMILVKQDISPLTFLALEYCCKADIGKFALAILQGAIAIYQYLKLQEEDSAGPLKVFQECSLFSGRLLDIVVVYWNGWGDIPLV